jgi:hypothetical protein
VEQVKPASPFWLLACALGVFGAIESAMIWWRIRSAPLFWICLVWLVVVLMLFFKDHRPVRVLLWPNLAAVLLAVGAVEGALFLNKHNNPYVMPANVRFVGDMARPNYFIEMPVEGLGYRPRPAMWIQAVKMHENAVIYNVRYSIAANGLRVSPKSFSTTRACVFMFGDSMAWGEGVEDDQTAAYLLGEVANGGIKVSNFAFTGYSAHQMLWQATTGMVRGLSECPDDAPVLAIYQTLPNNVARVAGLRGWDEFGPRYTVAIDGTLHHVGSFALGDMVLHDRYLVPAPLSSVLDKVNIYSRILGRDRNVDAFDYERFATVVQNAAASMHADFPRLQFVVLVWPELGEVAGDERSGTALLLDCLKRRGVKTVAIDTIIPWYRTDPARATISGDGHPNPLSHRLIAEYFAPQVTQQANQ